MLTHEVCKECKLTKKAIEYYTDQGLIKPSVSENGYRNFSESDIERLKKIAVLRGLGLSVSDINMVLDAQENEVLNKVSQKMELEISRLYETRSLIEELARNNDWESVRMKLVTLEKKQSILQRLLDKFPGYYGKYLSLHFASFLNEPINSKEQLEAFEVIISFLDGVNIVIPDDLKDYLDEAARSISSAMPDVSKSISLAIKNTEQYITDNEETLEQYMEFMKSDEYRRLPAYRLKELLKQFNIQNGYYEVFITALKKLSPSYNKYHDDLLKANEVFTAKYGDIQ